MVALWVGRCRVPHTLEGLDYITHQTQQSQTWLALPSTLRASAAEESYPNGVPSTVTSSRSGPPGLVTTGFPAASRSRRQVEHYDGVTADPNFAGVAVITPCRTSTDSPLVSV